MADASGGGPIAVAVDESLTDLFDAAPGEGGIAPGLRAPPARLETWAFWLSLKKISAPIERSIPVAAYCPLHGPDSTSRGFFSRATRVPRTRTRARHPVHPAGRRWGCCEPAEESWPTNGPSGISGDSRSDLILWLYHPRLWPARPTCVSGDWRCCLSSISPPSPHPAMFCSAAVGASCTCLFFSYPQLTWRPSPSDPYVATTYLDRPSG
jgi:hypothetical protein